MIGRENSDALAWIQNAIWVSRGAINLFYENKILSPYHEKPSSFSFNQPSFPASIGQSAWVHAPAESSNDGAASSEGEQSLRWDDI